MSILNAVWPRARQYAPALFMAALLGFAMTEPAFAAGGLGNIENVLKNIVDTLTGNVARLIATIAVILVGLAWMFNMVDLRAAAMVVLGIAIVFGAAEIVSMMTGG